MAYNIARVTFTAPHERITDAMTIVTLSAYVGQVLTMPLINWVAATFGEGSRIALLFVGFAFGVLMVISIIWILATKNITLSAQYHVL